MAKYVCTVCGYVHEGDSAPDKCPQCKASGEKFKKSEGELSWACEHIVGSAKAYDKEVVRGLIDNFNGQCILTRRFRLCNYRERLLNLADKAYRLSCRTSRILRDSAYRARRRIFLSLLLRQLAVKYCEYLFLLKCE